MRGLGTRLDLPGARLLVVAASGSGIAARQSDAPSADARTRLECGRAQQRRRRDAVPPEHLLSRATAVCTRAAHSFTGSSALLCCGCSLRPLPAPPCANRRKKAGARRRHEASDPKYLRTNLIPAVPHHSNHCKSRTVVQRRPCALDRLGLQETARGTALGRPRRYLSPQRVHTVESRQAEVLVTVQKRTAPLNCMREKASG